MRTRGRSRLRRRPQRHALCPAPPGPLVSEAAAPIELPTPALPGSGSTVGGNQPPSQPGPSGLPLLLGWYSGLVAPSGVVVRPPAAVAHEHDCEADHEADDPHDHEDQADGVDLD